MLTADYELDWVDRWQYRVAIVEAFRSYGLCSPETNLVSIPTFIGLDR